MRKKLTDMCTIQYGYAFDSKEFTDNSNFPQLVRIRDVKRGYSETFFRGKYSLEYIIHTGDLLIGMDGEFNIARWRSGDALLNQRVCKVTVKEDIDEEYLRFSLSRALKQIENRTSFVTVKHLSTKELNSLELECPNIQKQKEISDRLVKIEEIISLRQQQLAKLDELAKARFVEMFGDESNPFRWPIVDVKDIAYVQVGVVIKPAQYYTDKEHGTRTFRSLNIGPMYVKDADWVYFSEEGNRKNQKSILKENDLLVVRSGAPGTACVVTEEYAGCNAVDVIIAHPDLTKVNPFFLCAYTNLPHGKKQIDEGVGGAAQQHFNVGKYNKMRIILPPLEMQKKYKMFLEQVNKSKLSIKKSLEQVETLKKSLMQKYFG